MRRSGRPMGIALLFTLLLLAATATAATGTIQITVHPGGGTACLDTVCQDITVGAGGTGSTTFSNVEAGRYHMLNIYGIPGYKPWLGQIYLDPTGTSLNRDIKLEPLPPSASETGSVRVFVTPDGGQVCLDRMCEVSTGDGTGSWSVQFTEVTAKTPHTLTITNTGYVTYTTQVLVVAGETRSMTVSLQPLPPGSTPSSSNSSVSVTPPEPTHASLTGLVALIAIGICSIGWVMRRDRLE